MLNLKNKIVFITGASSGIGRACAKAFAELGARLILCARSEDKLAALKQELSAEVYSFTLDVREPEKVAAAIKALPAEWQDIDVLVNNAGLAKGLEKIQDGVLDNWDQMLDTNVKGLLYVTKAVLQTMLKRDTGHIINIGSVSGYSVYSGGVVYCASKYAVRAISEGLKMDVHGSALRVTEINPGMVETEFSNVRFSGDKNRADAVYQGLTPLGADDVADAVVYCATRPAHVDVREMTIMPIAQTATHMVKRDE